MQPLTSLLYRAKHLLACTDDAEQKNQQPAEQVPAQR